METSKNVIWSKSSVKQFESIYRFIFEDSEQNAEKVRKDILALIAKVALYPESYSPEKYKKDNDGSYRYFEKHSIRITYRQVENAILIVRLRHTSMKPKSL